jgi:hypothetical protein
VSYNLKEQRFRGLHRDAVRWPASYFRFVGNELPKGVQGAQVGSSPGERAPLEPRLSVPGVQ